MTTPIDYTEHAKGYVASHAPPLEVGAVCTETHLHALAAVIERAWIAGALFGLERAQAVYRDVLTGGVTDARR